MKQLGVVLSDRGSKYAVSGGAALDRATVDACLGTLKSNKKYAKATHNSWAVVLGTGVLRNDDGEPGAGDIIARMLERAGLLGHVVIVTRWYGGVNLGGDRFRHVAECVRMYLADLPGP